MLVFKNATMDLSQFSSKSLLYYLINLNPILHIFRCSEGMKFDGLKQQATCKDDGKWSIPSPRCLAPCLVPHITNGVSKLGQIINLKHFFKVQNLCVL